MKKNFFTYFLFSTFALFSQTVPITNIQQQVVASLVSGVTPNNPNDYLYQYRELPSTIQGVVIDIAPREIRKLWLQENNCLLQFQNINPVSKLEIDFDNTGFQVFHDGAPIQNIGWITPPTSFTTLGSHNIKVRFRPSLASTPLLREYDATCCSKMSKALH